jgi:hypothetical protein
VIISLKPFKSTYIKPVEGKRRLSASEEKPPRNLSSPAFGKARAELIKCLELLFALN